MVKINISDPKTGKTYQKEADIKSFIGLNIGEKIDGGKIELKGYELEITGGSDADGFPMRPKTKGTVRKRLLLSDPPGYKPKKEGERKRKIVRGNTVSESIIQINTKITKQGKKTVEELISGGEKESEKEK